MKKDKKWWQKEIIYQIYPASFMDGNNDGIGDLQGIISKLKYLKQLGVTTIWLSPIYKSPMVDNGYDISNYYEINPMFGNMQDFDELLQKVHQMGMHLIMDLVVNHTSDKHEWFQEAIKNPKSKYHNYYIFKTGKNDNPPNNWRSNFGYGSAWEKIPNSNEYYLHVFSKHQPDLNWENPELRSDIYKMINWWLDKGLDGFRIDAITFLKKDQDFASLPADGPDGLVKVTKKSENRPGIEKFLDEMKEKCFDNRKILTVGETSGIKYEDLGKYIGNAGVFSMAFDFHYADIDVESGSEWYKRTNWKPRDLKKLIDRSQAEIEKCPGGWSANFLENHDQPRSLSKYVRDPKYCNQIGAKALALMYFFLRGCPFIYQGQELGLMNFKRKSIKEFNDVSSISNYDQMLKLGINKEDALNYVNLRSRDNARTPFPWNNQINSGFNQGHQPWLELNNNPNNRNAEEEQKDKDSVFNFYKKIISLRNKKEFQEDLLYGNYHVLKNLPDEIVGYQRGEKFKVLVNLSNGEVGVKFEGNKVLLSNYTKVIKTNLLRPYEAVLIEEKEGEK